ncbi:thioredoxin [Leptolyngbya sp. FACHB-261]|uniref:thioredoxin n=1 Tax=Leptolyngbya sp. FACHB-261 TaxID=2692806 RepID=UPI001684E69D|nr:thioredoxin [Leptolyngbya sp. FACHB-261]MBD2101910.1 thioredoxin [Leptolyngbya sp. FACHB-261]
MSNNTSNNTEVVTLSAQTFNQEVLESSQIVLVDFWAPWCGPCRLVAPIITALAVEFAGQVKVGKLNIDENPEVASEYGITAVPTLMLFKDAQVVDEVIGLIPQRMLADKLSALLDQSKSSQAA